MWCVSLVVDVIGMDRVDVSSSFEEWSSARVDAVVVVTVREEGNGPVGRYVGTISSPKWYQHITS